MTAVPDEMIVTERFYLRFLRTAPDGVVEVVDRHHADEIEVVMRRADGSDGATVRVPVVPLT